MATLLDTNILLRQAEPGHAQHQSSVEATELLRQRREELVIVPQVLYEFWSVATRPIEQNGLGMTPAEAHSELAAIQRLFRLLRDERAIYLLWESLVLSLGVKGKKAHDAHLAAAMHRHSITQILTFNAADFSRYPQITAIAPDSLLGRSHSP
jgi:predicted nucleic acid-binding protein